ncbi:MAG TPA: energy transducer TonB [Rhizomicrobium sp.]|nr:energy transducer TonB [Rhizomicrobium sp.]
MNMRFTVPENMQADIFDLHPLRKASGNRFFDSEHLAGIAITVALHVAAIAALLYGGVHVARVVVPETVTVQIEQPKDKPLPPPVAPPPMVQPQYETIAPPDVAIQTDVPPPITVQVVEKPVVKTDPPAPSIAPETQASYLARVLAHLNRYKRYPAEARRAKIQGVVMLHFVMDKDGKVRSFDIAKSSGRPALDEEANALIQRAQPLPAIPSGYGKDQINAVVPIEFSLH